LVDAKRVREHPTAMKHESHAPPYPNGGRAQPLTPKRPRRPKPKSQPARKRCSQ
jgi:hypothetical protein